MTNLVSCAGIEVLTSWWMFCIDLSFHMRLPTSLSTYCHLIFPVLIDKFLTQKCANFEKTWRMTIVHGVFSRLRTPLNNVNVSKWHFECDPHLSADLTQRSRLFICVETNSWYMLSSSIALAVCRVSSAQFFSGKSMSMKQHYAHFSGRNPHYSHLPTAHMPWVDNWHPRF